VLSGPFPGPLLGLIIATVGTTPPLAATVSQVAPGYVYKGTINFIGPEQPLPPEEVGLVVVGAVVLGALVVGALVEGAVPDAGYVNAATQIVTYESSTSGFANSQNPSYATCETKDKFAMITYGGSSSTMQSAISAAKSKGYYGWVYVTDTGATGATYNSLPSFYTAEANYIASLN